jgi:RNA polymerase sigma factor (sigma-70 family)
MAKLPASVQVEDIIQNGMLGLLDALGRYEQGLGAQFETYAVQRIRGAMLDGLRENDWLPRSLRRDMRRIEAAIHRWSSRTAVQPTEAELADSLDMPLEDYQKMLQDARGYQLVYSRGLQPRATTTIISTDISPRRATIRSPCSRIPTCAVVWWGRSSTCPSASSS